MHPHDLRILRYVHAYDSGGGMEMHLHDLDRTLLNRHPMTIVRVNLARPGQSSGQWDEASCGLGRLVRISLALRPDAVAHDGIEPQSQLLQVTRRLVRDRILCAQGIWHLVGRPLVRRRQTPRRPGEPLGVGPIVSEAIRRYGVNLAMVHHIGGADSEEVIDTARRLGVPCAIENHFANDRFRDLSVRKQVEMADAVAGINGRDLPAYLRGRFENLSNGVDTVFLHSGPESAPPEGPPRILLPARIVREKGQLDLVAAGEFLARWGVDFQIVLAGRVDSESFLCELRSAICRAGLTGRFEFTGVLDQSGLRTEYSRSTVVAFPTHHDEGLGRVVVEAQAMERPVVAYDRGGVADGLLPGETGFLVKEGDTRMLADRLRFLLSDPLARKRMGRAGRVFVQDHFSLNALADRHEAFYMQVMHMAKAKMTRKQRDNR